MRPLRIVDKTALELEDTLGIPIDRNKELSSKIDEILDDTTKNPIAYCEVLQKLSSFCHNEEELVWVTTVFIKWLYDEGYIFPNPHHQGN